MRINEFLLASNNRLHLAMPNTDVGEVEKLLSRKESVCYKAMEEEPHYI